MSALRDFPGGISVELPEYPYPTWGINQERKQHWTWRHNRVEVLRMFGRNAFAMMGRTEDPEPISVTCVLPVKGNRRRDAHNFFPMCKAIVDGIVDTGLIPDDTADWITVEEPILDHDVNRIEVRVRLR